MRRGRSVGMTVLLTSALACSDSATAPGATGPALVDVEPQSGEVNFDPAGIPTLRFDGALAPGMEQFVALHRGSISGPVVEGAWSRSADGMSLRFQPTQPLEPGTLHTIHVGSGMTNESGHPVSLGMHGPELGGTWVTEGMMNQAIGMGGPAGSMMGVGLAHPTNGTFGMTFPFTTAG